MIDINLRQFDEQNFKKDLLAWYEQHKRDLPWRHVEDPYAIWVSEIMLQQTRVDTVIHYYNNFMDKFPTIYDLAKADEETVLKQWEGLGYYSRARNLHEAVREVVKSYDGEVPKNKEQLLKLKGIGPYTAGAIMSIAFCKPEPAVDGNVMRVLSRILYITDNIHIHKTRRKFERVASYIICKDEPASYNQALMELGALICSPTSPKCGKCPVQPYCQAYELGQQEQLPNRMKQKRKSEKSYIGLLMFNTSGEIAIEKRKSDGLLANMWQFPMIPLYNRSKVSFSEQIKEQYNFDLVIEDVLGEVKHVFSHLIWNITVVKAKFKQDSTMETPFTFVSFDELERYPFSVAHQKMLTQLKG